MPLIQAYQINLNSISGFIQSVATGTGVSPNYYPSNNPSGFIPSLYFTGVSGVTASLSGQYLVISSINDNYITVTGSAIQSGLLNFIGLYGTQVILSGANTICISGQGMTGVLTGVFYPLVGNPSNFITPSQTGAFQPSGNYYPLYLNPSGYLQSGLIFGLSGIQVFQSGQNFYISSLSDNYISITGSSIQTGLLNYSGAGNVKVILNGNNIIFSGVNTSDQIYFGYTGITISGSGNYSGNLLPNQGILTTRVSVLTGTGIIGWTGNFIIGNTNAFPGAIARYNFALPSGTGFNIQVSGYNGSVIQQPGLGISGNVYMEFSYDGSSWWNDQWA